MATKTTTHVRTEELARMHVDFFNNRKLAEGARHATADFESTIVPFGETLRGSEGYEKSNQMWVDAFPDGRCEVTRVMAGTDAAVVEFRGKGTHKGALEAPGVKIEATGKKVDMPFVQVWEFKGDKAFRSRLYFDTATMMRQLGQRT